MKTNVKKPGALFVLFLLLLCAGLTWFFAVAEDYYDYASESIDASAQQAPLAKEDFTRQAAAPKAKLNTEIKFRNFFLTVPGAKTVELQADFNRWGKTPLPLKAYSRGYFETSVALPAGEYKYVFVVDGKDVLDPGNLDRTDFEGRTVCIKTVK